MKNKFFVIILSLMFILPFSVFATENEEGLTSSDNVVTETTTQNNLNENITPPSTLDEDISDEISNANKINYKVPMGKRQLIKKFVLAMSGVGVSVLILFFVLNLYNKFTKRIIGQIKTSDGENSLQTPDNIEHAVKNFLDKTNWRG